ncbi:cytochrome P450 [Streptomyces sp. NPDC058619]|uniref:cytochrome P450 n=1 Tax=unclassified Streptomyces TaxID=2593676 RepID=UPI0036544C50
MTATLLPPPGTERGPRRWPLLGNLPAFARDPLAFFASLRDGYGDWVPWSLGLHRNVLVSRPEHAGELLGALESTFKPTELGWAFRQLLGNGVVVATGDDWRRKRALVQPAVRPRKVRSYATAMVECADALVRGWREGDRIDVHREMAGLTQRIAVRTLFGSDAAGREAPISAAMATAQRELGTEFRGITLFLPPWVQTPGRRRMRAAVSVLDREIEHVIREHESASAAGAERDDLLSRLLAARDERGGPLSRKELRDESITLYIGGHEGGGGARAGRARAAVPPGHGGPADRGVPRPHPATGGARPGRPARRRDLRGVVTRAPAPPPGVTTLTTPLGRPLRTAPGPHSRHHASPAPAAPTAAATAAPGRFTGLRSFRYRTAADPPPPTPGEAP